MSIDIIIIMLFNNFNHNLTGYNPTFSNLIYLKPLPKPLLKISTKIKDHYINQELNKDNKLSLINRSEPIFTSVCILKILYIIVILFSSSRIRG